MPRKKTAAKSPRTHPQKTKKRARRVDNASELVILTGMSGSGKAPALKAFEDLGFYCVDNLPLELVPHFAHLIRQSAETSRAALVVDGREGQGLDKFPAILKQVRKTLKTTVIFLEASN